MAKKSSKKATKTTKKATKTTKKSTKAKKTTKKVPRNSSAMSARSRKSGGPMKDKRTPRGGAKNIQAELTLLIDDSVLDAAKEQSFEEVEVIIEPLSEDQSDQQ